MAAAIERFVKVAESLPQRQALAATLHWRCGWRNREIADALEITDSAVSQLLGKAEMILRRELRPYLPFEPGDQGRTGMLSAEREDPRELADRMIGFLFAAAERPRLSHEPAHDEAAALSQFNAWLDRHARSRARAPGQPGQPQQDDPKNLAKTMAADTKTSRPSTSAPARTSSPTRSCSPGTPKMPGMLSPKPTPMRSGYGTSPGLPAGRKHG